MFCDSYRQIDTLKTLNKITFSLHAWGIYKTWIFCLDLGLFPKISNFIYAKIPKSKRKSETLLVSNISDKSCWVCGSWHCLCFCPSDLLEILGTAVRSQGRVLCLWLGWLSSEVKSGADREGRRVDGGEEKEAMRHSPTLDLLSPFLSFVFLKFHSF